MSKLIDDLVRESGSDPRTLICSTIVKKEAQTICKWYIAKPLPFYSIGAFFGRLKDAYRVLIDKSRAYHYKEDEV